MVKINNGMVKVIAGLSLIALGAAVYAHPNSAPAQREEQLSSTPVEQQPASPALEAGPSSTDQIQINTYVMDVSCDNDQFGIVHWSNTLGANGATFTLTGNAGALPNTIISQNRGGAFFKNGFILRASAVQATIRALIQRGELKSINSPVTYTRTGEPVQIRALQDQTIFLQSAATATTPYTFSTGLTIDLVPRILSGGIIDLKINSTLSAQTGTSPAQAGSNATVPIISASSVAAEIKIKSSDAAVIGAIVPETDNYTKDGIPGLRNSSLLGYLFQTRQKMRVRTNLVIIVWPKIVRRALKRDDRLGPEVAGIVRHPSDLPGKPSPIPYGVIRSVYLSATPEGASRLANAASRQYETGQQFLTAQ